MESQSDLDLMLSSAIAKDDAKEKIRKNNRKLRITRGAHDKIQLYADLTSRITHTGMECYGYLLKPKWGTDDLITNIYFADDQQVNSAYVRVPVEGIKKAMDEVDKMDYEIVGWWHSHDTMPTFHSGTDERNFRKILDGISPHTIFRNESAPYIVDEKNQRVVFEDYALLDLSSEELKIFKEKQIKTIKKNSDQPYAFSMVVNNFGNRYLEKITKTFDKTEGEFKVNNPIHPKLEIVDTENDLEFLVADVEWDVREKIVLNGRGYTNFNSTPTLINIESENDLGKTVDNFSKHLVNYVKQKGDYSQSVMNLLFNQSSNVFNEILTLKKQNVDDIERKECTLKNLSENKSFKRNIQNYFEELESEKYSKWRKKIHMFDRQHIIGMRLMQDICMIDENLDKEGRLALQNKVFEKYHNIALRLNNSFDIADKAMKTMTKYAMETITDYKDAKGHKYKNLIGELLTKFCVSNATSFERETQSILDSPRDCIRNNLFIWEDRFNICDQLVIDIYQLKIGSIYKLPELTQQRKKTVQFLHDFAKCYVDSPGQIDVLIEENLLGMYGVNASDYNKFSDSNYFPASTRQEPSLFDMYKPGRSIRINQDSISKEPSILVKQKKQPSLYERFIELIKR
jgi:hypothetical protein